jgi:Na+/phosphate symporter
MIGSALLVAIAVLLAYLFWLMGELRFVAPYKAVLFHTYGNIILAWLGCLFLNVFTAVYLIGRKFFLKDAGRKLWHVDLEANRGLIHVPRPNVDEEPF